MSVNKFEDETIQHISIILIIIFVLRKLFGIKPVEVDKLDSQVSSQSPVEVSTQNNHNTKSRGAISHYTIVDLRQGTQEWLGWRNQGIGASDAPIIMGENPWKNAANLLREKCGMQVNFRNQKMERGIALEPDARKSYEKKVGVRVNPACLQSTEHTWQRASVDGLAGDGSIVVEIKCGESVYRKASTSRAVPNYYYGQLQHILAVTHLSVIDFYCYLPGLPAVHLRIPRDDQYIKRLLNAEYLFWQEILKTKKEMI